MTKNDVANALAEIGTLLELAGESDFRTRAYHNGSRILKQFTGDFDELVRAGSLGKINGIGDALADKITTLVETGSLNYLDDLRKKTPAGLIELLRIQGLGPKKAKTLYDELNVDSIDKLKSAIENGNVAKLKGFGAKTASKLLEGITFLGSVADRVRWSDASIIVAAVEDSLYESRPVPDFTICGSFRRCRETVKDIDIVVPSNDSTPIMDNFVTMYEVVRVIARGPTKSSVVVQIERQSRTLVLNVDLRVVTPEQFPFAVLHFTGSKNHNIELRRLANDRGWTLNEYGLTQNDGSLVPGPFPDETSIYNALGLPFIPPEMREATGETELTTIPTLVNLDQLQGAFHNHTTASDGKGTLLEMATAAQKLGWKYLGIADHSQSLTVANGLTPDRIRKQWAEIDMLNKKLKGLHIFKGTECDILTDGSLDFDDDLLQGFDYVVGSVHTNFGLSETEQTQRVCKALSHPALTMLGHATGRLLLRREGFKIDLEAVLQAALKHGKMIEINAQPDRLDLDWVWVKRAKELGVMLVINPDAHSPDDLSKVRFGINVARRGWLTAAEVFNTQSLAEVRKRLKIVPPARSVS